MTFSADWMGDCSALPTAVRRAVGGRRRTRRGKPGGNAPEPTIAQKAICTRTKSCARSERRHILAEIDDADHWSPLAPKADIEALRAQLAAAGAELDAERARTSAAISAFAALADRLDQLAAERARPWWRRLVG